MPDIIRIHQLYIPCVGVLVALAGTPATPEVTARRLTNTFRRNCGAGAIDHGGLMFGFTVGTCAVPAFAEVTRGHLRLLLAGPGSSAGRPMPDGRRPGPGGWNRIHFIVDDIEAEVARLRAEGVSFRNEIVTGPGGKQILAEDPSGNVVELFQPAASRA